VTPASFRSLSGPFEGLFVVEGSVVGASVVVAESVVKMISSSSTSLAGEEVVVVVFFPDRDRVRDKTVLFLGALAHATFDG
jgi:hypothetical protein